jgi:cyanophycin synthetase
VTDVIHPDNREMAVRAVTAIGLDVGGVDFLCPDIAESYKTPENAGSGICEINAAPGFRMHVAPSEGTPRDAAGPVIDMLFPANAPSRVPIAAITGTNGKTTTSRMLAHITKMAGYTPGLTTTDGVYIDGQRTVEGDMTGPVATRMVLADPKIDIAVLEVARGGLVRAGMGVPWVNVGAVLNVQSDHLGTEGHQHAGRTGRGQAHPGGSGTRLRGAQCRRRTRDPHVGAHRRQAPVLRHHEPAAHGGA